MPQAPVGQSEENVEGVAWLKLYKGSARVVGRKSPRSLYSLAPTTLRGGRGLRSARHRRLHQT
jgi:argininosuccinate synthase